MPLIGRLLAARFVKDWTGQHRRLVGAVGLAVVLVIGGLTNPHLLDACRGVTNAFCTWLPTAQEALAGVSTWILGAGILDAGYKGPDAPAK